MNENSGSVTQFVDEAGDPTLFGKGGKVVKNRKQAIAIALSEGEKVKKGKK